MIRLLPQPKSVSIDSEKTYPWPECCLIHPNTAKEPSIVHYLECLGIEPVFDSQLEENCICSESAASDFELPNNPQAYCIHAESKGMNAVGGSQAGLRYALITLLQIKQQSAMLPGLTIEDEPAFTMRYHHDDISRKQISTLEDFKRILRLLAGYKITHYTLYIEDVLHLNSHPLIGMGRGKLMPEEVAELNLEAQKLGIEIFPTFTLLGHFENILRDPQYAHLGTEVPQMPSSLDPSLPEVRAFLKAVIKDVCELFPSSLFHMGFDETQGVDRDAFIEHANWCAEEVTQYGKTPVIWIDKFYDHFGIAHMKQLHPQIIPVVWGYDKDKLDSTHLQYFGESQLQRDTWALAGYNNWCRIIPDGMSAINAIQTWASALQEKEGNSIGCSQWGDDGYENHRDLSWHLFAAFADIGWNGSNARLEDVHKRFQQTFYGAVLPVMENFLHPKKAFLKLPLSTFWEWHRLSHSGLMRIIYADETLPEKIHNDFKTISTWIEQLAEQRGMVLREQSHLVHWESALMRCQSVLKRASFAIGCLTSLDKSEAFTLEEQANGCRKIIDHLGETKAVYEKSWKQNNRIQNIEASLKIFDRLNEDYTELLHALDLKKQGATQVQEDGTELFSENTLPTEKNVSDPSFNSDKFYPIDLSDCYNVSGKQDPSLAFIPLGVKTFEGVPYSFPAIDSFYWKLEDNQSASFSVPDLNIVDLHLVASCPMPEGLVRAPTI